MMNTLPSSRVVRLSVVATLLAAVPALAYPGAAPTLTLDATEASTAPAANTAPPTVEPPVGVTGDWAGRRTELTDKGFTFAGSLILDVSKTLRGGVDTEKTVPRYLLDLNLTLDTAKAFGHPGGTLFAQFQSHDGPDASGQIVGDVQGFNNIDAPHFVQLFQLWYAQKLFDDRLTLKAGKIDAGVDFSVMEHGKEFENTSFGYSATMYPISTYPDPGPGGSVSWSEPVFAHNATAYASSGAYYVNRKNTFLTFVGHPQTVERSDGGLFFIGELGLKWEGVGDTKDRPGHIGVGGWGHNGRFPDVPGHNGVQTGLSEGTGGAYLFGDQTLWLEKSAKGEVLRDVGYFYDYGWSDPATNAVTQQAGAGLAVTGLIPGRTTDICGVAGSWAQLGHTPGATHDFEIATELFYKCYLARGVILKPDVQYITHPSGRGGDALVVTMRVQLDF